MTDFTVPDTIEPIVAWRYWRLSSGDGQLRSLTGRHQTWAAATAFEARCRFDDVDRSEWRYQMVGGFSADPHPAPHEGCTCGVYAARTLEDLRGQPLFGLSRMVVGQVALWGKVIPGQFGFRAQFAYPTRLCLFEETLRRDPSVLAGLAAYDVPVEVVGDRRAAFSPRLALVRAVRALRP